MSVASPGLPSGPAKTHKSSAPAIAVEAMRAMKFALIASLENAHLQRVPTQILTSCGAAMALRRWSLILNDEDIELAVKHPAGAGVYPIDPSQDSVKAMFARFWTPLPSAQSLAVVDISGAAAVTDYGLALLVRHHAGISELDVSGCSALSDVGVREAGLCLRGLRSLCLADTLITGSSLLAVADHCHLLSKLNVSRCTKLEKYGLVKVFYKCTRLEWLNMSHLALVGDCEVAVLAYNCPRLCTFIAKDTPNVSDQSIIALAQSCRDLEHVDVSRRQLQFKITDASLLALGESSATLRVLRAAGCDQLTDVGLTWLSEGCRCLEELDVAGCPKVTDAGLRSVGQCHALASVDVRRNKSVSDVGLSSLSVGCPGLRHLCCDGLFLLSDPRIPPAKRRSKTHASVGISALAHFCPSLEKLHLSGCFQLNVSIERFVSTLTSLRDIDLSGCKALRPQALVALAEGCTLLENVNLSDCGEGVTGAVVEALGAHCRHLKAVNLTRCEGVLSIRALCGCAHLHRLELAECCGLVNESLIPLCDERAVPALTHLSLAGIKSLTDPVVAWIAAGSKRIVYLSLTGTRVSSFTARAVKDAFPHSTLMQNQNFFGFWPLFRYEDRVLHKAFNDTVMAVTKLQAVVRAMAARRRFQAKIQNHTRNQACLALQCVMRAQQAKREVHKRWLVRQRRDVAATTIQSVFRVAVAKKTLRLLRAESYFRFQCRTATKIQTQWRVFLDRRKFFRMVDALKVQSHVRVLKAIAIQCTLRRMFARNHVRKRIYRRRARERLTILKAVVIQRVYRGHATRVKLSEISQRDRALKRRRLFAVRRIQCCARAMSLIRLLKRRYETKMRFKRAAILIQSLVRQHLARLFVEELRTELFLDLQNSSALLLQGRWRITRAKRLLQSLREESYAAIAMRNFAATQFSKHYRARAARILLLSMKEEARQYEIWRTRLILLSAIKLQAFYRGVKGRRRFDKLMREKRGLWIELFDEDKQQRFFFSKVNNHTLCRLSVNVLTLSCG